MRQDVIAGQRICAERSCLRPPEESSDTGKLDRGTRTVPCRAYLTDEALGALADSVAFSLVEEFPGADLHALARTVAMPVAMANPEDRLMARITDQARALYRLEMATTTTADTAEGRGTHLPSRRTWY